MLLLKHDLDRFGYSFWLWVNTGGTLVNHQKLTYQTTDY